MDGLHAVRFGSQLLFTLDSSVRGKTLTEISKTPEYRAVIDDLVKICRDTAHFGYANVVRKGVWNRNATSPEFDRDQYAFNQLLSRLAPADRETIARMLVEQSTGAVFETLKVLEFHAVEPFKDGYEGSSFHDFIGRLGDWEWPE